MRAATVHSTRVYDRSIVLAIFTSVYVALAAMQQLGPRLDAALVLLAGPVLLGWVWRVTRRSEGLTPAVHPVALGALRYAVWGTLLWLGARTGPAGRPGFDMAANIGLGIAVVAAQVALARVPGNDGLIRPPRSARSLDAAAFCAVFWGIATALPAARALWLGPGVLLDPLATDYATSAASIASMLLLMGAAGRMRLTRQLELGVLDRAAGALALVATAFSVALPAALLDLAPPDRALPLGALAAALACAWAVTTPDATSVATSLRAALVVMVVGAPLALTAAGFAQHVPRYAGLIALFGAGGSLLVGIVARAVARPLTAEQSRWLTALEGAGRAAREAEPDAAIVATLSALQRVDETVSVRPELWRRDPPEAVHVDVAGYLHTQRAQAPDALYELARDEPERMLRRDALAALEVRRPEVRELGGWMDAHDALFITLVTDEQAALGLIVFPRGSRKSPITLREAIAARELCDRLSAVLALSSSIARSRNRETEARERADELVVETAKLEAIIELTARPHDYLLEALAASARVAAYSARARAALDTLGRAGAAGGDVALEVPVGVDALAFAAFVHQASTRRAGPFVLVDGTSSALHAAERFRAQADSPVARARGGTLVVLNLAALPLATQDVLAVALSERPASADQRPHAGFALVASLARPAAELFEARQLSRALARFILPNLLALPPLVERPEDLRGLVLDSLCKSGVRGDGQTLGIEPLALSLLVDHDWPGNVAELDNLVQRAARLARGDRVSVADLAAAGFAPARSAPEPAPFASLIPASGVQPQASGQRVRHSGIVPAAEDEDLEDRVETKGLRRRRRR